MRKQTSKRRWIARFMQGKWVPATALIGCPGLKQRLAQYRAIYSCTFDAVRIHEDQS